MNRTTPWLVLLVALIGALAWRSLGRRPGPREGPAIVATAPASATEAPVEHEAAAALAPSAAQEPAPMLDAPEPARTPAAPEPATPRRTFSVRVVTRASSARDAPPVPGLAFQVFAQRSRVGTPASTFGIPAPAHAPTDPVLFAGRTDESGTASFELDSAGLVLAEGGLPLVCGRVVEPGYQQATVGGRDAGGLVLDLRARRGATARGRVVDEQGVGVWATVRLRRVRWRSTDQGEQPFVFGPAATMLADGWFELHFAEPILDGCLLAEAGPLGTASLPDLELALGSAPTDLRLVVSGPGVLAGRVRDGAGEPAAGVDLLVQLAELDRQGAAPDSPSRHALTREAQGGGHLFLRVETDAHGEFEAHGLRRLPYVVRARTGQDAYAEYSVLLTPRPVLAGGEPLELALHRPTVVVRLVREDAPLPAIAESIPRWRYPKSLGSWPDDARVMLYPCTPGGVEPLATGDALVGERAGPNEVLFEVPDGARYLAGARGGGFDGTLHVVEVPVGSNRVTLELEARELGELGSVAVRVVNAGRELGRGHALALALETLTERVRLVELADDLPPAPWVLSAPAGRYRLVVDGRAGTSFQHGTLTVPRAFGRAELEVELRAGAMPELTLELDEGARLEVTLAGTPDAADLAAVRDDEGWSEPHAGADPAARVTAALALEQPGRRPEPLVFAAHAWAGTSAAGTHLLSRWPLGATQRSEVVPTGRYTLVARLPGGRAARREVELAAGTTTAVRLEF